MAKFEQKRPISSPIKTDKELKEYTSSIQQNLSDLWEHSHDHDSIGADVSVETGDRVVVSDSEGVIESSDITTTELETLNGVTSNIQTQINSKEPALGFTPVPNTRTITAGSGLSGGGNLTADRTLDVNVDGTTIEINSDTLRVKAGGIGANELASTAVTPASYTKTNLTVDSDGRITAASNGAASVDSIAKSGSTALTGAVTLTGGSNVTLTQVGQDISIAATATNVVFQIVHSTSTTQFHTTSATFVDTNLTGSITPSNSSHRIMIIASAVLEKEGTGNVQATVARNGTNLSGSNGFQFSTADGSPSTITYIDSPATTSAITYTVQLRSTIAGQAVDYGEGGMTQSMILIEIA